MSIDSSVALLLGAQTPSGAIPASTVHDVYQYGWLRDGSWCAYALDRAGHREAGMAWHHWVARTLLAHEHRVDEALAAVRDGRVNGLVMMPARFTLEGEEEPAAEGEEEWPNFQTDCYGFWLWALADHLRGGSTLDPELEAGARLAIRYLMGVAETACYDCWEEHPGNLHTSSVAIVAAGLRDMGAMLGDTDAHRYGDQLRDRLIGPEFTLAGGFVRFPGDTRVDGSLLWLGVPWGIVDVDDPLFAVTLERVRDELYLPGGGVRRYQGDTFYGGAEWILLAASMGWASLARGDADLAPQLLDWIQASSDENRHLPESVSTRVQSPHMLTYWRSKWGTTATPLLWSHAMYLILCEALATG
ncbi:MAG: glycoside hydrolase family 15 protein [Marmoricola sp.]